MTLKPQSKSDFLNNDMTWKCIRNISVNYYSGKKKKGTERERETRADRERRVIMLTLFMACFTDWLLTHFNPYGTQKQDAQPPKALGSIKTQLTFSPSKK